MIERWLESIEALACDGSAAAAAAAAVEAVVEADAVAVG